MRIQEVLLRGGGGGGGSRPDCKKTAITVINSPQLILQFYSGLAKVYFKGNYNFRGFREGPT